MDKMSEKRNQGLYILGGVALALLILFLIGFVPRYFHWQELKKEADDDHLPSVTVMEVKADPNPIAFVLPSSIQAMHVTPIWARTNGYLIQFYADIGDHVEEGQLIANIDTPEIDAELLQAKADLESLQAKQEIARITADRWETLYKKNPEAIPRQEVDEKQATYVGAQADVLAGKANVERLEKLQGFKNIYAPFKGIIIERNIDTGSLITAGSSNRPQQLFKIAQTDIVRVFVNVPQYYFRKISDGVTADVTIREFPGRIFKGTVARNAEALDLIARTLLTEIHVDNHEGALLVGLYAEVKFSFIPDTTHFIIPTDAVIIRAGGPKVAVLNENNHVHLVPVTIGRDYGKTIQITEGLKQNDRIVTNPSDRIKEGVAVSLIGSGN